MSEYKIGTRINIIGNVTGSGMHGVIKRLPVFETGSYDYHVLLDGESEERIYFEDQFEFEDIIEMEIPDETYFEMSTVKWGFMSIKLAIFGDEGPIPHFHFYKNLRPEAGIPPERRNGGGCICIDRPNYFTHGRHKEKLKPKEIEGLIKFLKSPLKAAPEITNWKYIIIEWNSNNTNQKQLDPNMEIPEYKSDMPSITD